MSDPLAALNLEQVRFGYLNRPEFLGPVDVTLRRGQLLAVVGPNGSGKSTLLRLMAGLLTPRSGRVHLSGEPLASMSPRRRAQQIALLPQRLAAEPGFTARDVVLMGRFPFRSLGVFESAEDHAIAEQAMGATRTLEFADRSLSSLSGGELQRVHLAAALAQQPGVLLLDEPTASLDLRHEVEIFELVRRQAADEGRAVVAVTHDVNMAVRFADDLLLLSDGKVAGLGRVGELANPEILGRVYGVEMAAIGARPPWFVPAGLVGGGRV